MSGKQDAYDVVTARIVEALEAGVVPWARPWRTLDGYGPTSLGSGKAYRGVNVMTLGVTGMMRGYESQYWTTFRQAKELGGTVRKGEKASPVVFWKIVEKRNEQDEVESRFGFLRYSSVFNVDQCDGITAPVPEPLPEHEPIAEAERIADGMKQRPNVKHSPEDRAYYSPSLDYVHMPLRGSFTSPEGYYATLFHELVHSTGHESRLARKDLVVSAFGDESYAREELVAEIGAAYLCGAAGIEPRVEQSASYIASWLKALSDDRKLVVTAAGQAAKASDWILGREA